VTAPCVVFYHTQSASSRQFSRCVRRRSAALICAVEPAVCPSGSQDTTQPPVL
jgi:hypothetical protein